MKQVPISDFERRYQDDPILGASPARRTNSGGSTSRRAAYPLMGIGEASSRDVPAASSRFASLGVGASSCRGTGRRRSWTRARKRVERAGIDNVELAVGVVPAQWPSGRFDLVVLSEIGYYFDRRGLARAR